MTTRIDGCPSCGYRRCSQCPVKTTRVR
ncbi:hypothetical protein CORC01_01387 [Colletotrichum orchidophilum]|uniref:Uncharacterized protein n=1 Tax=Colletotrichum orchidophilum TaxID=1209926 RepID=A0A1G4BPJ0_9PEZI|nr:hypothetical protein CORC01_01387 [Colletotrichum orchidophilum]